MALVTLTSAVAGQVATAVFYNNNNNALLNQINGNIDAANLANLAVTGAKIASGAVSGSKIAMGADAQGDILYFNGTTYARLGAGTSGKVLVTGGAGANPAWGSLPNGITQAVGTTDITTTSTSYVDMDDMAITIPTSGKYQLIFNATIRVQDNTITHDNYVQMLIDGASVVFKNKYLARLTNTTDEQDVTLIWEADITAGQVVKIQWKQGSGYSLYQDGSTFGQRVLQATRIL
jgi:hypothetical protein